MTPEDLEPGKNYFCTFQAAVDPDTIPQLAGKERAPITTINGTAQILQRDVENELVEVIDLDSHQRYIVGFGDVFNIQEAE
jgi:hypothetical protein